MRGAPVPHIGTLPSWHVGMRPTLLARLGHWRRT